MGPDDGIFVWAQEDVETSLENLQDIDMMDISVLDEAEIDNGSVADCVEDDDADGLPESLCDSRDLAEGDLQELPEQLQEHGVGSAAGLRDQLPAWYGIGAGENQLHLQWELPGHSKQMIRTLDPWCWQSLVPDLAPQPTSEFGLSSQG